MPVDMTSKRVRNALSLKGIPNKNGMFYGNLPQEFGKCRKQIIFAENFWTCRTAFDSTDFFLEIYQTLINSSFLLVVANLSDSS